MNIDINIVILELRKEAERHRDEAMAFTDSHLTFIWSSRVAAANTLDSLATALTFGALRCPRAESSSSPSATKTAEDSFPQ